MGCKCNGGQRKRFRWLRKKEGGERKRKE